MPHHEDTHVTRRCLFRVATSAAAVSGAALLLAACAQRPAAVAPPRGPSPLAEESPASTASPPTPSPAPTPTIALPDPAEVAARFAGHTPTGWGMALPGIRSALAVAHTADGRPRVALTFDACGDDGGIDHALIDALRALAVPATLFLNARWISAHPAFATELAADPLFVLGNHGSRHRPLSVAATPAYGITGTASAAEAVAEVWDNHVVLTELCGVAPRHFRAGTAHYDDVAVQIVHALGEEPIGFTVNGDGGASYSAHIVHGEFRSATAGGIVLAHMNHPGSGTAQGTREAVATMRAAGVEFVHVD